jgi:hypothetical protein
MDVLFVRWFKRDNTPSGFTAKRLLRLEFFEDESPDAFGFMRFRGGAVGHKAMRGWDDILQRDGHVIEDLDDEAEEDIETDDEDSSDEELDMEDIEGDESEDDETDTDSEDEGESDEDWIIADYGEVLDDDILADEGYGAL